MERWKHDVVEEVVVKMFSNFEFISLTILFVDNVLFFGVENIFSHLLMYTIFKVIKSNTEILLTYNVV